MDAPRNQIFFPQSFTELFAAWRRFPDMVLYAGGTGLPGVQGRTSLPLPPNIISLDRLEELRHVTRSERYLEIGAMVPLSDLINLGKTVPEVFTQALRGAAAYQLWNLATLGGNICHPLNRQVTAAALIALDARYELRTASQSRWISASRFASQPAPGPQELLTRIRIPLEPWDYSEFRIIEETGDGGGWTGVFIARNQKNILTGIRAVFAGDTILQDRNSEAFLEGKRLPLDRREALHFTELWKTYLAEIEKPGAMVCSIIVNFVRAAVFALTG